MSSKLIEAASSLVREIEDGMLVELSSKFEYDLAKSLLATVKSALAEPLRNCDVGTAEEQFERWDRYCKSFDSYCDICGIDCKAQYDLTAKCFAFWAQMPYESEIKKKSVI